jgi:phosphoribosylglycinamide formyltransferase-1
VILYSPNAVPAIDRDPPPRLAILASGSGTNFAAICDANERGEIGVDIVGLVYNNEDAFVAQRAAERDIPTAFVDHRTFDSRELFDAAVVEALRDVDAEWVAMAGWMRIASPVLLNAFPNRILNIHPSLLPSFRGLHAVEQSIAAGVKVSGCTVHIVSPVVDDGPIIAQAAVGVEPGDDADSLHERIHEAEHVLYPRAIALAIASEGQ